MTDYSALRRVLDDAFTQASDGKGRDRHADGEAFHDQPWSRITSAVGLGFPLGQAAKKLEEGKRLADAGEPGRAVAEWLGAIVYLAMAVIHVDRSRRFRPIVSGIVIGGAPSDIPESGTAVPNEGTIRERAIATAKRLSKRHLPDCGCVECGRLREAIRADMTAIARELHGLGPSAESAADIDREC